MVISITHGEFFLQIYLLTQFLFFLEVSILNSILKSIFKTQYYTLIVIYYSEENFGNLKALLRKHFNAILVKKKDESQYISKS